VNLLCLTPVRRTLSVAWFRGAPGAPASRRRIEAYPDRIPDPDAASGGTGGLLGAIGVTANEASGLAAVGIRVPYGGNAFGPPVPAGPDVLARLERLCDEAPLALPPVLRLLRHLQEKLPEVPVILAFATGFFVDLPERESSYALDWDAARLPPIRRYGFHGLFHEAACAHAGHRLRSNGRALRPRILSICLEPRPEIAAILCGRPLMVTSGATPLEGLPGHTTCGEIDPSIPLLLAERLGWGPEKTNRVLTQESGLLGLAGRPLTLEEIFRSDAAPCPAVRAFLERRMLLACGAGVAT
jgi:acetate kinase